LRLRRLRERRALDLNYPIHLITSLILYSQLRLRRLWERRALDLNYLIHLKAVRMRVMRRI
jgi:hypothetical protein